MSADTQTHRCCGMVSGTGWYRSPCRSKASIERDGKWYCKTHDPVSRKERDDNRMDRMRKGWEVDRRRREVLATEARIKDTRAALFPELLGILVELFEGSHDVSIFPSAIEGGFGADLEDWGNRARAIVAKAKGIPTA